MFLFPFTRPCENQEVVLELRCTILSSQRKRVSRMLLLCVVIILSPVSAKYQPCEVRKEGREESTEGGREEGREEGRKEGRRKGGRKEGREGGREEEV